jgi:hypothetical protein
MRTARGSLMRTARGSLMRTVRLCDANQRALHRLTTSGERRAGELGTVRGPQSRPARGAGSRVAVATDSQLQ